MLPAISSAPNLALIACGGLEHLISVFIREIRGSNGFDDLFDCLFRFGQWSKHPIVDHAVVFTIIDIHAFSRSLVSELPAIRTKNVARADEHGDGRKVFQAPVHRAHKITLRIDVARVNFTTILQTFDTEKRIDLIKLRNLRFDNVASSHGDSRMRRPGCSRLSSRSR